ncbi:hypothetical protein PJ311_10025 [Bacillus sp. CLL-7-23]|uniref:Uncharacterized protein n=1 Tax=Bacillus changyiensis TaxID=3004103 RepID=A0ABT4X3T6_9BACI|nr:hypothetical protein [Bacillus changyiensis]MDA7026944.1 hypothetical protein [Bacillus changyiensis]
MRRFTFLILGMLTIVLFFQNRYRVLNFVLGQDRIRHYFIHWIMRIPFFRNKFTQPAY